ncbi:unnamed protein product [Orchesella dallaii]|uniref:Uncharacterized protein n=1 Tax=Orchesella dallaii TaxID=48710 RepID=A0ABP1RJ66_9HEXA
MPFFFNPLCGFPLKRGAKGVAIFDLVVAVTFTFIVFYNMDTEMIAHDLDHITANLNLHRLADVSHQEKVEEVRHWVSSSHHEDNILIRCLIWLAILGGDIWLSAKLWRASNSENTTGLVVWMGVRSLYIVLLISADIYYIDESDYEDITSWIGLLAHFVQIFGLLVVNGLRKEILAAGYAERI